jgi:hypothetical protein
LDDKADLTDLAALSAQVTSIAAGVTPVGGWDASSGTFPSGAAANTFYVVSTAGTVDGQTFGVGDWLIAITATPSTSVFAANWTRADYSQVVAAVVEAQVDRFPSTEGETGKAVFVTNAETDFGYFPIAKIADPEGNGGKLLALNADETEYEHLTAAQARAALYVAADISGESGEFTTSGFTQSIFVPIPDSANGFKVILSEVAFSDARPQINFNDEINGPIDLDHYVMTTHDASAVATVSQTTNGVRFDGGICTGVIEGERLAEGSNVWLLTYKGGFTSRNRSVGVGQVTFPNAGFRLSLGRSGSGSYTGGVANVKWR